MAIKSKIRGIGSNKPNPFPKLMVSNKGNIVLFCEPKKGTVVYAQYKTVTGEWSDTWAMSEFIDYEGEVRLSNYD